MIRHRGRQMNRDIAKLAACAAPAMFFVLWSTGFIGAKYVLRNAEPLTYLAIRMVLVVALMAVIVAVAGPPSPDRIGITDTVVAGTLVHCLYSCGPPRPIARSMLE